MARFAEFVEGKNDVLNDMEHGPCRLEISQNDGHWAPGSAQLLGQCSNRKCAQTDFVFVHV